MWYLTTEVTRHKDTGHGGHMDVSIQHKQNISSNWAVDYNHLLSVQSILWGEIHKSSPSTGMEKIKSTIQ